MLVVSLELLGNLLSDRGMVCDELLEFFVPPAGSKVTTLQEPVGNVKDAVLGRVRKVAFVTVIKISL